MSLKNKLTLLATSIGDVLWNSAQQAAIGSSMGNGAAQFASDAQNPLIMGDSGNLNAQVSSAGVQPGATGADNVLAVFSIPASAFDKAGRGIQIRAHGSFGSTANNKRIKIIFNPSAAVVGSTVTGGTTIADTGTVATNGGGWSLGASVFKYGNAGSNTQLGVNLQNLAGAASSALLAPAAITATESGAILVAVTGNATTAASDVVFNLLQVLGMN